MAEGDDNNVLSSCCNEPQIAFCTLYVAFLVFVFITRRMSIVKPMRLIAVFLHEMSHAVACWLTCGRVMGIEVYNNEGGVTKYIGGCRILIIPAGYIGCAFWGMVFVILSGGRKTATFAASAFVVALLITLCYSPNRTMVYLNLGYAAVTAIFIALEWFVFSPLITYIILFYGVCIGTFAIFDIVDGLILRTVKGSDAYACWEIMPCCLPRCVGVQWMLVAIFFQFFGLWWALVLLSEECEDQSWGQCFHINLPEWELDFDHLDFWDGWDIGR
jgi:hypothetical protein